MRQSFSYYVSLLISCFPYYNSSLTMLGGKTQSNNSNQTSETKSSLPNDEMSQVGSDLDDEIPF